MIPRAAFTSTTGMRVVSGNGLDKIVADETADMLLLGSAEAPRRSREYRRALELAPGGGRSGRSSPAGAEEMQAVVAAN